MADTVGEALTFTGRDDAAPIRPEARIETVDGVIHVWNPAAGFWAPGEEWTVDVLWRVGGELAPEEEEFSGPRLTVAPGPDGKVHVLDADAAFLSIFSANGQFLRRIGRSGRGPGEFVAPSALTWDAYGRLWVADGFGGRYQLFSPAGELIRTHRRPVGALAQRTHRLLYLPDGTLLDEGARYPHVLFLKVDTIESTVDTLGILDHPPMSAAARAVRVPPGSDIQRVSRVYVNRRRWTLSPDQTLWTADTGKLELIQRTLGGDTIRVVHTLHRPAELSSADNRVIERALSATGLRRSDLGIVRPVLQQIMVLDDGHLLVQIETDLGEDSSLLDVFDPSGRYLGPLDVGFRIASTGVTTFRGDTLFAPVLGRLDVPYVVKAVIRRPRRSAGG